MPLKQLSCFVFCLGLPTLTWADAGCPEDANRILSSDEVKQLEVDDPCHPGCYWEVEVVASYKACQYGGRNCSDEGAQVIWPRMPIAIDPDYFCRPDIPQVMDGEDAPFDIKVLNGESDRTVSGDLVDNDSLWLNIGEFITKGNDGLVKRPAEARKLLIDFYGESQVLAQKQGSERDSFGDSPAGINGTHQCMVPGGYWGECAREDIAQQLMERNAFSFKVHQSDPMTGKETSDFFFRFTPVK